MPLNIPGPSTAYPTLGSVPGVPQAHAAGPQAGPAAPHATDAVPGNMQALVNPPGRKSVPDDFRPLAVNPDQSLCALAGVPPLLPIALPHATAEQYARGALEQTMGVINDTAGQLLLQSRDILAKGTPAQQHELLQAIERFLKTAQATMQNLVDQTVRNHLGSPPSPSMQKLIALFGTDLWRGLDTMQQNMQTAFDTPTQPGVPTSTPDATMRKKISEYFVARQVQDFQVRLDAIDLPAANRAGFDVSKLPGMAALRQELLAVTDLAQAVRTTPGSTMDAAPALPRAMSGPAAPAAGDWKDLGPFDGADEADGTDEADEAGEDADMEELGSEYPSGGVQNRKPSPDGNA